MFCKGANFNVFVSESTLNPRRSKVRNAGGNFPVISCDRATSALQRLESYASGTKTCSEPMSRNCWLAEVCGGDPVELIDENLAVSFISVLSLSVIIEQNWSLNGIFKPFCVTPCSSYAQTGLPLCMFLSIIDYL